MSLEDVIKRIASKNLNADEETVKFREVAPILEELGWDVMDKKRAKGEEDVEFEVRSISKATNEKVDIQLISNGDCVAIVEVKSTREKLDDAKKIEKLVTYAFGATTQIAALTNGKEWWLYFTGSERHFEDRCFVRLQILSDDAKHFAEEFNTFLLKRNLTDGTSVREAKKRLNELQKMEEDKERIRKVWKNPFNEMIKDPTLFPIVVDQIYNALAQGKKLSRKRIEFLIHEMHDLQPIRQRKPDIPKPKSSTKVSKTWFTSPELGRFILWGSDIATTSYKEAFQEVAIALYRKYGDSLLSKVNEGWKGNQPPISDKKVNQGFTKIEGFPWWAATERSASFLLSCAFKLLEAVGEERENIRAYDQQNHSLVIEHGFIVPKGETFVKVEKKWIPSSHEKAYLNYLSNRT